MVRGMNNIMETSTEKTFLKSIEKKLPRGKRRDEGSIPEFGESAASFFTTPAKPRLLSCRRNCVSLFMFLSCTVAIMLRSNINIAIIDMTVERTVHESEGPDFNWTPKECGFVFSVFSFGQMVFSIPAGWIGSRHGAVKVIGISILVAGLLTVVTPALLNSQEIYTMLILGFFIGALQAVTLINMTEVAARWIPSNERSRFVGVFMAGVNFGTALSYVLSGTLAQIWRWPAIYYVTGTIAVIWSVLWLVFIRECPEEDPWITNYELAFLNHALTPQDREKKYHWKRILTSKPVIALCVYRFANGLEAAFIRQLIPMYVSDVLKLSVGATGLLTCLITVPGLVSVYFTGVAKDLMQNRDILSPSQTTTIFISLGTIITTSMQFAISFLRNHVLIIICLFLCPFSDGIVCVICNVNCLELSSEYANIISGISSMFSTLNQIIGPVIYGLVVTERKASQWSILLCSFSIIELCGLIFFLMYASTDEQNFHESFDDDEENSSHRQGYTKIR